MGFGFRPSRVLIPPNLEANMKRMLEIELDKETNIPIFNINFSSLDLLQTCKRKAFYSLELKLGSGEESAPLVFGSAIHKALEYWYLAPPEERAMNAQCKDIINQLKFQNEVEGHENCPKCGAVRAFIVAAKPIWALDVSDKRSVANGCEILSEYFLAYQDDPFVVVVHKDHGPLVEKSFQFNIHKSKDFIINLHGTIDLVLTNPKTNISFVIDHKTTSQLGTEFYNRLKPNHQYTGYVWAAREVFGIDTNVFMVNGIQVAKTKKQFARQFTERNETDFNELKYAMIHAASDYILCRQDGYWPQSAPGPCANYGGCQYRGICELPEALRKDYINMNFKRSEA